jgi:aminoglycoside 6'-N-acetyltransferase I
MITIRHVTPDDAASWLSLRHALWSDASESEHRAAIEQFLAGLAREPQAVLVAIERTGRLVGFAELSIRAYAEGCDTDHVAFLEGWYVAPEFRRRGVARSLLGAAEHWAIQKGCRELASDTPVDNAISATAHEKCGFTEVAVIRCFRKELPNKPMHATCEDARVNGGVRQH